MFTEYVDPLSSPRHTYALARRSSFTPICLRSPGTIQPWGTGLDLLHHVAVYIFRVCSTFMRHLQIIRLMRKILIDCLLRLYILLNAVKKKIERFSENYQLIQLFYLCNIFLFFISIHFFFSKYCTRSM